MVGEGYPIMKNLAIEENDNQWWLPRMALRKRSWDRVIYGMQESFKQGSTPERKL